MWLYIYIQYILHMLYLRTPKKPRAARGRMSIGGPRGVDGSYLPGKCWTRNLCKALCLFMFIYSWNTSLLMPVTSNWTLITPHYCIFASCLIIIEAVGLLGSYINVVHTNKVTGSRATDCSTKTSANWTLCILRLLTWPPMGCIY